MKRRQLLQAASAIAAPVPLVSFGQTAYKSEYRISLVSPPGTLWYQMAERFTKLVDERTQGRVKMKMYPGSSLVQGQQDRELVALRQGLIDVIVGPTGNYAGTVKELGIFNLPYLMSSSRSIDGVLASDALVKDFYDVLRKAGVETLASAEYGYMQVGNSKRKVLTPGNLKGLKIRTVGTPMQQELMSAYGANPTTMPLSELLPSLSTGAVDGLAMTMEQFVSTKMHKLGIKHISKWNAWNELLHVMVAGNAWRTWTPDDQQRVRSAAQDAARETTVNVRKSVVTGEEALKAVGVEVSEPSRAQMEEWQTAARRVYARWKASLGPELVSRIEAAAARA
jgi:TRAP-type transport system periplasmic protein